MNKKSEFAVASLVMGIVSFVQIFGMEKPIVAIIFAVLALKRISREEGLEGKKLAIAGAILGTVAIIAAIVAMTIFLPKRQPQMMKMQQAMQAQAQQQSVQ